MEIKKIKMSLSISNLYKSYAKLIASNAETCADVEILTKYLGYFVGGKKNHYLRRKKSTKIINYLTN